MQESLIDAVFQEDVQQVEQLLCSLTEVEAAALANTAEDLDKITPLHFVAQKHSEKALQIARLLMRSKADPLARSEPYGQTPLDVARWMSSDEMIAVLSGTERLH